MDQWTDEQEIALLKAVVKWKPVGMHKHFRMIGIRDFMLSQGVVNPTDEHTRIPGIWQKLGTLYDLRTLDEREDSIMNDFIGENGEVVEYYRPFDLPDSQFEDQKEDKFQQARDLDGSESPELLMSRRESTIADTDEPRSSPVSGTPRGSGRGVRASARKARASKLQNELETSRRTSKATSTADDETMEDADEDEDQESVDAPDDGSEPEDEKKSSRRGGRGSKRGGGPRGGNKKGRKR